MDINDILAFNLEEAIIELNNHGYIIDEVNYLNQPPGNPRVVRIKEVYEKKVKVLVSYHNDVLN